MYFHMHSSGTENERLRSEVQRNKSLRLLFELNEKSINTCNAQLVKKQETYNEREGKNNAMKYAMSPYVNILIVTPHIFPCTFLFLYHLFVFIL